MIKAIRTQHMAGASSSNKMAAMVADNFALLNNTMPKLLNVVHAAHKVRTSSFIYWLQVCGLN
jgi:hypothetical protein